MFLIMHQGLLGENSDSEDDFDVQDWLEEEESFFMVVEVNENLCRQQNPSWKKSVWRCQMPLKAFKSIG